ncbi:MAG: nitrogenase component 1 [Desulfobacterales bacterium]
MKKKADLFIGNLSKEASIAYKMGIGFCDHNHERKIPLAGYSGMLNFAKEVYLTVSSPVWKFARNQLSVNSERYVPESRSTLRVGTQYGTLCVWLRVLKRLERRLAFPRKGVGTEEVIMER